MYDNTVLAAVAPSICGICVKFVSSLPKVDSPTVNVGMPFARACATTPAMLVLSCGSIERQSIWLVFKSASIWLICSVTFC